MIRYGFISVTVLVLIALAVVNVTYKPHSQANQAVSQGFYSPQALLTIINRERASMGVQPLKLDTRLNASAQLKADDMVTLNYYGHVSPKTGMHGYSYITKTMPECYQASENITNADTNMNPVSERWDKSTPHHAAQVNPDNDLVGFASKPTRLGGYVYVAHFCDLR